MNKELLLMRISLCNACEQRRACTPDRCILLQMHQPALKGRHDCLRAVFYLESHQNHADMQAPGAMPGRPISTCEDALSGSRACHTVSEIDLASQASFFILCHLHLPQSLFISRPGVLCFRPAIHLLIQLGDSFFRRVNLLI